MSALRSDERRHLVSTAETWGLRDAALAMWSHYTSPSQVAEHQAFFYVFSLALQQPESYHEFLQSLEEWTTLTAELGVREGLDPGHAQRLAQLLVSSIRGLLMDRLTSADTERVDAAFALLLEEVLP